MLSYQILSIFEKYFPDKKFALFSLDSPGLLSTVRQGDWNVFNPQDITGELFDEVKRQIRIEDSSVFFKGLVLFVREKKNGDHEDGKEEELKERITTETFKQEEDDEEAFPLKVARKKKKR